MTAAPPSLATTARPTTRAIATIVLGLLAGIAIVVALPIVAGMSKKLLVLGVLGSMFLVAGIAVGQPRLALLFAWVGSLTYDRAFYKLAPILGDHGAHSGYIILSDAFLALLFALWAWEVTVLRRPLRRLNPTLLLWFAPFPLVALVGAVAAEHPEWALVELLRWGKIAAILVYFAFNMGRAEWLACAAGLGAAACLQAGLAVLEVVAGRSGVLWLIGLGTEVADIPKGFEHEAFYGTRRGIGTMNHPPHLADYFITVIPMFVAVMLGARAWLARLPSALVVVAGLAGLGATLSRWPWMLMVLALVAVAAVLMWLRLTDARRVLGLAAMGLFALMLALAPLQQRIIDRFTGDFRESVDYRLEDTRVALAIFAEAPLLGTGINNYRTRLVVHDPRAKWALKNERLAIDVVQVRLIVAPLNLYLFVLAETGIIGFLAYLLFPLGIALHGMRAIARTRGGWQAAQVGLLVGMGALLAAQVVDHALWADPLLNTMALVGAMLAAAPRASREGAAYNARVQGDTLGRTP